MYEPTTGPGIGSMGTRRKYRENAPAIQAKNMYYHSDGSGRDGYIV